jgi:hypothetical protein
LRSSSSPSGAVGRTYVQQYLWTGNNQVLNGGIHRLRSRLGRRQLELAVPSCDLWEEIISSSIFWNLVHFKLAMQIGSEFAGDHGRQSARATKYAAEVAKIDAAIAAALERTVSLRDAPTNGRLVDSAVFRRPQDRVRAAPRHCVAVWRARAPTKWHRRCSHYANAFFNAFSINQKLITTPGLLMGRYLGDTYGGGNPWILSTAQLASVLFEVAFDSARQNGTVSRRRSPTWNSVLDSSLQATRRQVARQRRWSAPATVSCSALEALGQVVGQYQLSEQLDKASGVERSATNLTWSVRRGAERSVDSRATRMNVAHASFSQFHLTVENQNLTRSLRPPMMSSISPQSSFSSWTGGASAFIALAERGAGVRAAVGLGDEALRAGAGAHGRHQAVLRVVLLAVRRDAVHRERAVVGKELLAGGALLRLGGGERGDVGQVKRRDRVVSSARSTSCG